MAEQDRYTMSRNGHGSVAGRSSTKRPPQSTEAARRQHLRAELAARLPTIQLLAAQVGNCLPGPDPEAALVYLAELRDSCSRALQDLK